MADGKSPGRPFPPLLFWALLVPAVMFVGGCLAVVLGPRSPSNLAFALFVIPMVMGLAAVPIAVILLVRGGYETTGNVILTLSGAIPVVVFFGMWLVFSLSHIHF